MAGSGGNRPRGLSVSSQLYSQTKSDQYADDLVNGLNTKQYVGSVHHIVPRFILERFAEGDQVFVRDRAGGFRGRQNIKNLGVRDFYTFIDNHGELNSSHESILGFVEGDASQVLKAHLDNPFRVPRPFADDERLAIDTLVSTQAVRGHGMRRVGEVLTDYYVKITNQDKLSDEHLTEYEFIPHQNDLLNEAMQKAHVIHELLRDRDCLLVTLDRPLLVTCDEPVLVFREDDAPDKVQRPFRSIPRSVPGDEVAPHDLIRISGSHLDGIATAEMVAMPIGPKTAIVYNARGTAGDQRDHLQLYGDEANAFAGFVLEGCVKNACAWIVAHPEHRTIATMRLPRPKAALIIDDGGTPMSKRYKDDSRRTARRLNKNAKPTTP
jgi:hypothetical protein